MCFKGRMNGLPQGAVVSPGQWAEGCGEKGCAQALWAEQPEEKNRLPVCGSIHEVPILDSDLLHSLPKLGFFRPHPVSISKN